VVMAGGVIPDGDIPALHELGVHRVFTPGTPLADIVSSLRDAVASADRA